MKYSSIARTVLQLGGGTGDIKCLIRDYEDEVDSFEFRPLAHPVIILIDNDDGANGIFGLIKNKYELNILYTTTCPFYHLYANLYLVKTPEKGEDYTYIEQLFDQKWLEVPINGKEI